MASNMTSSVNINISNGKANPQSPHFNFIGMIHPPSCGHLVNPVNMAWYIKIFGFAMLPVVRSEKIEHNIK
jgi:hypothetical protein